MRNVTPKIILSASRRTDIPAFYLDWFMAQLERGRFETVNPFNRRRRVIAAEPRHVHTIVFWSKNYERFLAENIGEDLQQRGYHLFFHYTLNSESGRLEPNMPPLRLRLEQLQHLARRFGPRRVQWRFDPVCFYMVESGRIATNLADFSRIARFAGDCGIQRCVTSMLDLYPKVLRRRNAPEFIDPPHHAKRRILQWQARVLHDCGMQLLTCCEKDLHPVAAAPRVSPGACISADRLTALAGEDGISHRSDRGQRHRQGCGCSVSVDVGDYRRHPCSHGCRYCYANPVGCG